MRRFIIIGAVVAVLLCVGCIAVIALGGLAIFNATQPVVDASNEFMEALKAGNYADAYAMMGPELQSEVGSAENLSQLPVIPESWSITSRNISTNNGVSTGDTGGTLTAKDGSEHKFTLTLRKSGDDWFIIGYNFDA